MMKTQEHRRLHVVDIENLLGDPRPCESAVVEGLSRYQNIVRAPGVDDLVVVACNHGAALAVGCCLDGHHRLTVRSGPDGADHALLDVLAHERVEARFGRIVVASGDGIFAEAVSQLTSRGVPVTVVSRLEALSARLRLAATEVLFFEPEVVAEGALAVAA